MKTAAAFLATLALASTLDATAQTPPCGSTVHGLVQLNADLHCPAGMDALTIGSDKVRIELNGFAIVAAAPLWPQLAAVRSWHYHNVEIVGPGKIAGFSEPIHITGGTGHLIEGVEIDGDNAITLVNVSGTRVQSNLFSWLNLSADPGMAATGNHVWRNRIVPAAMGGGMQLIGCGTRDNTLVKNEIDTGLAHAIRLFGGPSGNQILGNKAVGGGIHLWNSPFNRVDGNYVEVPDQVDAVFMLSTGAGAQCPEGHPLDSVGNAVTRNDLVGGKVGVNVIGYSTKNLITDNYLFKQRAWSLAFSNFADDNDARGNHYPTGWRIDDQGIGNLWP